MTVVGPAVAVENRAARREKGRERAFLCFSIFLKVFLEIKIIKMWIQKDYERSDAIKYNSHFLKFLEI